MKAPARSRSDTTSAPAALGPVAAATLTATYRAEDAVFLPLAPAGLWRGQLGAALHRAAQARAGRGRPSTYEALFRTPRSAVDVPDRPARILGPVGLAGDHVPHPFVLRMALPSHRTAPLRLSPGDPTRLVLGLVGEAVCHLPGLAAALDALGARGIGRTAPQPSGPSRQGRLTLREATLEVGRVSLSLFRSGSWRLPRPCDATLYERTEALLEPAPPADRGEPSTLTVRFETPVRLAHKEDLLTRPDELTTDALAHACYRRWAALALCYAPTPPPTERLDAAFKAARALGRTTTIAARRLEPVERTRRSATQEKRLSRTGLQGAVRLAGPPGRLAQWRRWIECLTPLHLGKSTSMGFGRVGLAASG